MDTDILEAAVSCKIDSGINIFSYENAFYFHRSEGLPTVAIQLKRGSLEDISEEKGFWSNAGYSVWDKEGNHLRSGFEYDCYPILCSACCSTSVARQKKRTLLISFCLNDTHEYNYTQELLRTTPLKQHIAGL